MPALGSRGTSYGGYFGYSTRPNPPVITQSTQAVSSLEIAFNAPSFNGGQLITRYERSVSTDGINWGDWVLASSTVFPPVSPVIAGGLVNGQPYYVKMRAVNGFGPSLESNVWNINTTPRTVPDAPTITSMARGCKQLTASFSAPAFNGGSAITNYEYSTNGGTTWLPMGQAGTANYLITGLADSTSYNVRIRAVNVAGPGAASGIVSATTAELPAAPTIGAITRGTGTSTVDSLAWTAPTNSGGSPITGYVFQTTTNNGSTFSTATSTGSTAVSRNFDAGYTNVTTKVRVAAVNCVGTGPWSSISTTGYGGWISVAAVIAGTCPTPTCTCTAPTCTCTACASCDGGCDGCGTRSITGSPGTSTATAGTSTGTPGTSSKTCYKWTRSGNSDTDPIYNQDSTNACTAQFSACTAGTCSACTAGTCSACTASTCGCSECSASWSDVTAGGCYTEYAGYQCYTLRRDQTPFGYAGDLMSMDNDPTGEILHGFSCGSTAGGEYFAYYREYCSASGAYRIVPYGCIDTIFAK